MLSLELNLEEDFSKLDLTKSSECGQTLSLNNHDNIIFKNQDLTQRITTRRLRMHYPKTSPKKSILMAGRFGDLLKLTKKVKNKVVSINLSNLKLVWQNL